LTVVLGANGLGKTTLVTLLYRMCTGPFDIPGFASKRFLGGLDLDASRLPRTDQTVFASRVADRASQATATLKMTIREDRFEVTRSLNNLAVTQLHFNDNSVSPTDSNFQDLVTKAADIALFGDWVLLLRYLVFYFEDRRALVWDPTAQSQVLRLLSLPKSRAAEWASKEREVLELDSRVRNLQNALSREEVEHERVRSNLRTVAAVSKRLAELQTSLAESGPQLAALNDQLAGVEAARQRARLQALTLEQERDSSYRSLERLQLATIQEAFPSQDETGKYLIARLISTDVCQTCGHHVPGFAAGLQARLAEAQCVICGSPVATSGRAKGFKAEIKARDPELKGLEKALGAAMLERQESEAAFSKLLQDLQSLDATVTRQRAEVAELVKRLPPSERALQESYAEISSLRGRLTVLREQLDILRSAFQEFLRSVTATIAAQREEVVTAFEEYAQGFLFEACQLKWSPHRAKVGQLGSTVEYPAYEFEMSGSDFPTPVRRSGPEQVSESQREFVDLAFRMALIRLCAVGAAGSLIIDAPESSLDAVFSDRAADVLMRFGDPTRGNRLILTSNLIEGGLIPDMLHGAKIKSTRSPRVLDLLSVAFPTAATRLLADEYRAVRDGMFAVPEEA
jgi:hypothetical protein